LETGVDGANDHLLPCVVESTWGRVDVWATRCLIFPIQEIPPTIPPMAAPDEDVQLPGSAQHSRLTVTFEDDADDPLSQQQPAARTLAEQPDVAKQYVKLSILCRAPRHYCVCNLT